MFCRFFGGGGGDCFISMKQCCSALKIHKENQSSTACPTALRQHIDLQRIYCLIALKKQLLGDAVYLLLRPAACFISPWPLMVILEFLLLQYWCHVSILPKVQDLFDFPLNEWDLSLRRGVLVASDDNRNSFIHMQWWPSSLLFTFEHFIIARACVLITEARLFLFLRPHAYEPSVGVCLCSDLSYCIIANRGFITWEFDRLL